VDTSCLNFGRIKGMDNVQKLTELFKEFPGIGPRQAKRFVYFLLTRNTGFSSDLSKLIAEVRREINVCDSCFRFFPQNVAHSKSCTVCRDASREANTLMLVSHDVDFENIEKTHSYSGYYFILGGSIPILEKNPEKRIRQNELFEIIKKRKILGLSEIIVALNYNPEGEHTLSYLQSLLRPLAESLGIKISTLGRGLSTGTELEYSDTDTIKNALKNRQ